jgi:hypothetical protein
MVVTEAIGLWAAPAMAPANARRVLARCLTVPQPPTVFPSSAFVANILVNLNMSIYIGAID